VSGHDISRSNWLLCHHGITWLLKQRATGLGMAWLRLAFSGQVREARRTAEQRSRSRENSARRRIHDQPPAPPRSPRRRQVMCGHLASSAPSRVPAGRGDHTSFPSASAVAVRLVTRARPSTDLTPAPVGHLPPTQDARPGLPRTPEAAKPGTPSAVPAS
jgi:hypothetical protein